MASSPPRNNSGTGNFDDINLVEAIAAAAAANGDGNGNGSSSPGRQNTNPSNPAFYSLAHGCTIDDLSTDEEEEMDDEQKREGEQRQPKAKQSIPEGGDTAAVVPAVPITAGDLPKSTTSSHNITINSTEDRKDGNKVSVPAATVKEPCMNGTISHGNVQQQQTPMPPTATGHSPPPIYTTVYPPGMYSALAPGQVPPAYMPPPQIHPPASTYIIDASTLSGMPGGAVLIRSSNHHQPAQAVAPVLIITEDAYSEYARRRRALAILAFMLCFFPMIFFLLMLLSTMREGYY